MTFWHWFFAGMCLFGFLGGIGRGFLRELAAFIGTLVGVIITPVVVVVLHKALYRVFENGSWAIPGLGPLNALIFVLVAILLLCVLPISIMAFRFISQSVEVFLLGVFKNAPAFMHNKLLGACVGVLRYGIYGAVTYFVVTTVSESL